MIHTITKDILKKYGSLENPDYWVASKPTDKAIEIRNNIQSAINANDVTDENDDVSFVLTKEFHDSSYMIMISWIGPYIAILRTTIGDDQFVAIETKGNELEKILIDIAKKACAKILSGKTLLEPIKFQTPNSESSSCPLYKALFSDIELKINLH